MTAGVDASRMQNMLQTLQSTDPQIDNIVAFSKFVVAYLLQQDGANPGWRKANIEGPVYLVHRRTAPRYQLMVKNQFSTNDLLDNLHADWELDCQKNYVFYKVEDPQKKIRGLWFHDDNERMRIEAMIENTLREVRKGGPEMGMEAPMGLAAPMDEDRVAVSTAGVKSAIRAMADDENFINLLMHKLRENARASG